MIIGPPGTIEDESVAAECDTIEVVGGGPMPELETVKKKLEKRKIQTILGVTFLVSALVALIVCYPRLQFTLAEQLIEAGKYPQAEAILTSLMNNKNQRNKVGYRLVACQLFQGKSRQAAQTVLSLTGSEEVEDLELAIVFRDVAKHLLNTGNPGAALELAKRVRTQSGGEMLQVAVKEVSLIIAKYCDLPLALDAVNLALAQGDPNWQTNQKVFNLLLLKALESPADLAEPALDRALELYPGNIIAITRKASIVGDRIGPKEALEYLEQRDVEPKGGFTPEFLAVKRSLLLRLAAADPKADLTQYTQGMPQDMLVQIAKQGLNYAWLNMASGRQYYYLAPEEPQVAYQFGRNLMQMRLWDTAKEVFQQIEKSEPEFMDFRSVYAALDSKTRQASVLASGDLVDAYSISPNGKWLAWRRWREEAEEQIMVSNLVLTNLSSTKDKPISLGDAIAFQWSPDSNYLALHNMTYTGLGRLHIFSIQDGSKHTLPTEYDVIDFNWSGDCLMVQAQYEQEIVLLNLVPPLLEIKSEKLWQLGSDVNPDYAWLNIDGKTLEVYKGRQKIKSFDADAELVSFSCWAPNGNLAIIEDIQGKSWIYNHQKKSITPVKVSGRFAGWGKDQNIFWFLPLWDQLYVLVHLNSQGSIQEYYPYSLDGLYDISIAAGGEAMALMDDNSIFVYKK